MNLNKFLKIIIVILGLFIVVFSGYSIYSIVNKAKIENPNQQTDLTVYQNKEYGFKLDLPSSWKNYSVIVDFWEGRFLDGSEKQTQGSKIIIKNSQSTEAQCWQDLIVLIFNKQEWDMIEQENLSVSAAPIGPQKIGENQNYIFALPPRWVGFTDCLGQDEAQEIMKTFKIIDNFENNSISLECLESEKYFFISNNENILIKYKQNSNQKITCEYFVQENDFQIEGLAKFFLKFENDFLILDFGTSPSYRRLLVYDLIKKEKIYEDYYSKPIIIENNSISYWALSNKQATKENCSDFEKNQAMGLGTVIELYQMIDLTSLEKKDLNQERCQITQ